jgi:hypothetical protein
MSVRAGREPIVRQKARMPPSTIPPEQVRQIMAELQGASAVATEPVRVRTRSGRRIGMSAAFGLVLVGGVLGAAIGFFAPDLRKPPQIADKSPSQPTFMAVMPQPVAPPPVVAATPATEPALRPEITPAKPVEAAPPPAPVKPKSCVAGGPCTSADVRAAERRLQSAYDTARRAGVPSSQLTSVKQRWNTAKARSAGKPRTTVGAYRSLASELYGKADRAKAKSRSKRR